MKNICTKQKRKMNRAQNIKDLISCGLTKKESSALLDLLKKIKFPDDMENEMEAEWEEGLAFEGGMSLIEALYEAQNNL